MKWNTWKTYFKEERSVTTFKEGYKGDCGRIERSRWLDVWAWQIVRNEIVRSFDAFSLRKWKVHMGMNIINFNENYSMGANIASLNEQQNKEVWKINS